MPTILHLVVNMKDIRVGPNEILPLKTHLEKASEELKTRGNPPHDEFAFLDRNAWKI